MKSTNKYVKRDPDCVWRVIDDNALIVRIREGRGCGVFTLNKTGTAIWESTDGQHSVDDVIARIRDNFVCPQATDVAADVHDFMNRLVCDGLLEAISEPQIDKKRICEKR